MDIATRLAQLEALLAQLPETKFDLDPGAENRAIVELESPDEIKIHQGKWHVVLSRRQCERLLDLLAELFPKDPAFNDLTSPIHPKRRKR